MTELTTAPEVLLADLDDDDILLIRRSGVAGAKKVKWGTLKSALEAGGASLPAGGTLGQVLAKLSDDDGDAGWVDAGEGGGGGGLYRFGGFFTSTPGADEVLMLHVATDAFTLPADLDGTRVAVGTNPDAATELSVQLDGVEFGTISISDAGAVTLASPEQEIGAGDVVSLVAPADSNGLANTAFTFRSLYVGTEPAGDPIPAVVNARAFNRTPGGELDVPFVPTAGNILIAMIFGRSGFGAGAGWTSVGENGNGNVSSYECFAKIATGAETGIVNPSDSNGFVGSGVLFEIDAAYLPGGGIGALVPYFTNASQDGPTVATGGPATVIVAVGNQDPPQPFNFTVDPIPPSLIGMGTVDRGSGYLYAGGFHFQVDEGGSYHVDFQASGNQQGTVHIVLPTVFE